MTRRQMTARTVVERPRLMTSAADVRDSVVPAFEITNNGMNYKIFADGRVETRLAPETIGLLTINRIPMLTKEDA